MAFDWTDKDDVFGLLTNSFGLVQYFQLQAKDYITDAWIDWLGGHDHSAIGNLIDGVKKLRSAVYYTVYYYPYDPKGLDYPMLYYLDTFAVVNWRSIAEAWVKDDFEGRFWTIGIIDRMRQIMWDEPFNIMWAARPEQEEI